MTCRLMHVELVGVVGPDSAPYAPILFDIIPVSAFVYCWQALALSDISGAGLFLHATEFCIVAVRLSAGEHSHCIHGLITIHVVLCLLSHAG